MKFVTIALLMMTGCSLADLRPAGIEELDEPKQNPLGDAVTEGHSSEG